MYWAHTQNILKIIRIKAPMHVRNVCIQETLKKTADQIDWKFAILFDVPNYSLSSEFINNGYVLRKILQLKNF